MSDRSRSEEEPSTPPRRRRGAVRSPSPSPSPKSSTSSDNIEAEVTAKYVCGFPVNEDGGSEELYVIEGDELKSLYVTPSALHTALVSQFTYRSMLTADDIIEIRRRDNCVDNKYGLVIDGVATLTTDKDPIITGYYVAHALSKLHRNGILHLNVKPESVIYLDRPVLVGFDKAKLIQVEDSQTIPSDSNYLPPETGIVGYFTDVWALGITLLTLYGISPDISDYKIYSIQMIEPLIKRFFALDWTDKILDYYSDQIDPDVVSLIYSDYSSNGKDLAKAISARYSKDAKLIRTITREIGDNVSRKTISNAIKSANRARDAIKASKINTLLHSLLESDYRMRPTADTILTQMQALLPSKSVIQGDTYESRVSKGNITTAYVSKLINTIYQKCAARRLKMNVLLHAFDYVYRLAAITEILNLDLVIDSCINIADNVCNNARHSEALLDDICARLKYELFVSQIYANALNIDQIYDILSKLALGDIDYSTYRWEIIATAALPMNKQSINYQLN